MATTISFDTPQTSTPRPVAVTGEVGVGGIGNLTITLNITNASVPARNRSFYRAIVFDNSAGTQDMNVSTAYTLSIVPKLLGADTVAAAYAWSYDSDI